MKKLGDLAAIAGGRLIGNPDLRISDARTTRSAANGDITFAVTEQHLQIFLDSPCQACLVPGQHAHCIEQADTEKSFVLVDDAETSFAAVVRVFRPSSERKRIGISDRAIVSDSAEIAEDVDIFPGAFIGEGVRIGCGSIIHPNVSILDSVSIGANTVIFPNAVVYQNCVIGDRCIIHGGVVIGAHGFGYRSGETHELSPQLGNVVIGNDVEIGSNSTIDRGTFDSTMIGDGSKLDDQVMIGHNCHIGRHNLLCSQVGIAGSCTTGDYVVMAGQVGVGDHLVIGDKVTLAAQSGVMHDLKGGQTYLGAPAVPVREQMQIHAVVAKLPEMRKQLRRIQRDLENQSLRTTVDHEAA